MPLSAFSKVKLLPVRDQGRAGTCLAFATSSAHEHLHKTEQYLSPAYLYGLAWKTDSALNGHNGLTIKAVENVLQKTGQTYEAVFPYDIWLKSKEYPNASYSSQAKHYISKLVFIGKNFSDICQPISSGTPVIIGLKINNSFHSVNNEGFIDEPGSREMGGHAVVAVGMRDYNNKKYLLIRNSWGNTWGKNGHALVSEDYTMQRLIFARILSGGKT